ncbi:UDP-N-acetylmuramoyl-L-alanyl-D-glutamate--2,6-diaminopimelate ligase [Marinomonas aquiplantarum]|uniref:UDP-N-acetylmuramoyl-L-alanyl-D-glutamate--2,6-diaminopimelate ligase n=1 Tax=Marinomonas aquiplantarum TaxID=491951 RepID=A0A366CVW7_9GAMM|nr:UDP-N-acetylmuramoyl-L-alanyl-D-glutamate--2,6-diaminopimelate ligase [Marinomonas aquiplantarum]RBO81981.1 UDP-N-acetylmuramoylalanyl-D-glutamate--2,6-diaminopimelate ligase [Marinomonas aquiplantarum]
MPVISHQELLNLAGYSEKTSPRSALYTHLEIDSRKLDANGVFFALAGVGSNGWDYLDNVVALGCQIAIVPTGIKVERNDIELIAVADPAELLVMCLHQYFGHMPSKMMAVTGTNGKSSICFYAAQLAEMMGYKSGLVGTFGIGPLGQLRTADQTTPDILTMHQTLMSLTQQGVDYVAFEASSHALDQGRINGVPFQTAVFSNLTRDHLDYHGDMASYAAAKQKLFAFPCVEEAVFCLDDEYVGFMTQPAINANCFYYSEANPQADFYTKELTLEPTGCRFILCHPEGETEVFLPLLGRFNVQNALAAVACLWSSASNKADLIACLSKLKGAPGRMDKVEVSEAPLVVVDFAHTSDALESALKAIREHVAGRLICVFGCGGDRDRGKRPLMMSAAMANADAVWLTSDNPRTESVEQIFSDVLANTDAHASYHLQADRRLAIQEAVMSARPNDVILIAGKGHEAYQDIDGIKHHFDDKEEACRVLEDYVG